MIKIQADLCSGHKIVKKDKQLSSSSASYQTFGVHCWTYASLQGTILSSMYLIIKSLQSWDEKIIRYSKTFIICFIPGSIPSSVREKIVLNLKGNDLIGAAQIT